MGFANPLFLIALSALAIPVIIHLFNFRRFKKIYFTNVRFIAEIKQETRKRSQLKHLLILLMRLLAIACLVLAFAQPYLPSPMQYKKYSGKQIVSIYIDNSFSLEALASGGRLLDLAKTKAHEIADAYNPSDLFQLLTNDFEGRHQRFVNREELKTLVDEVQISPALHTIPEVIKKQNSMLEDVNGRNRSAYIISDFQKSTARIGSVKSDTSVAYFFIPVIAEKVNNLYIDSAWFDSPVQQPNQAVKLKVRIRNCSDESFEKLPLKLLVNNVQKGLASFSVSPRGDAIVVLPFTNNAKGIQYGTLQITDYPVTWDDNFYFSYPVNPAIPVLSINGDKVNVYLDALFRNDTAFTFTNASEKQLDYSSFVHYPLIILNSIDEISSGLGQEITRYIKQGGNVVIFPSDKINTGNYKTFLSSLTLPWFSGLDTNRQRIGEVNAESRIFNDVFLKDANGKVHLPENVDLPMVFRHYPENASIRSGTENLLKLQNGQCFLSVTGIEKGKVYLFSAPLDEKFTSFPKHSLFVPTLYKIALLSQPDIPLYYNIDAGNAINITADSLKGREVYKISKPGTNFEIIPEMRSVGQEMVMFPHDQIKEAGHYNVSADHTTLLGLAFNYNRIESDLTCLTPAELEKDLKQTRIRYFAVLPAKKVPLTKQIYQMSQGTALWKYFIILTLLFIAGEILLVRLLKE
ncbi:MAG: BatA domain-containing protein [Bacteroidetes bacterium]|nr:BatA domain-containing protein [Bacteroidota bacterium]